MLLMPDGSSANVYQIQPVDKHDKHYRYSEIITFRTAGYSDFNSARPEKDSDNNIADKNCREDENQPA